MRRLTLSVLSVAVIAAACSSKTTNEGTGGHGGVGGIPPPTGGAPPVGGAGSGGVPPPDAALPCLPSIPPVECFECCAAGNPGGYAAALAALRPPICDQKICSPCEDGLCVDAGDPALSLACKGCLYNDLSDGLAPLVEPLCKGIDVACMAWLECYHNCSGN